MFTRKKFSQELSPTKAQHKDAGLHNLDKLKILFENQSREVSDPSDYISEEEYATKVVLHGRKSSLNKPIGFQLI